MAVTVGLDHGPHRSGRGDRAQHFDVVPDRAEVDVGPRPTAHNNSSSTAGIKIGQVTGDQAVSLTSPAGLTMQPRPGRRGLQRFHAAGQQRTNDPAEHIAGTGCRQPGVARSDDEGGTTRVSDDGGGTLQQDRAPAVGRQPSSGHHSVGTRLATRQQRVLAIVRSQDGGHAAAAQKGGRALRAPTQSEQPVTIDHHRQRCLDDELANVGSGVVGSSQPGPDDDRMKSVERRQRGIGP